MPASNAWIYEMENKQLILVLCLYKRTHKLHIYEKFYHKNVYHFIVVFFYIYQGFKYYRFAQQFEQTMHQQMLYEI